MLMKKLLKIVMSNAKPQTITCQQRHCEKKQKKMPAKS